MWVYEKIDRKKSCSLTGEIFGYLSKKDAQINKNISEQVKRFVLKKSLSLKLIFDNNNLVCDTGFQKVIAKLKTNTQGLTI